MRGLVADRVVARKVARSLAVYPLTVSSVRQPARLNAEKRTDCCDNRQTSDKVPT